MLQSLYLWEKYPQYTGKEAGWALELMAKRKIHDTYTVVYVVTETVRYEVWQIPREMFCAATGNANEFVHAGFCDCMIHSFVSNRIQFVSWLRCFIGEDILFVSQKRGW